MLKIGHVASMAKGRDHIGFPALPMSPPPPGANEVAVVDLRIRQATIPEAKMPMSGLTALNS